MQWIIEVRRGAIPQKRDKRGADLPLFEYLESFRWIIDEFNLKSLPVWKGNEDTVTRQIKDGRLERGEKTDEYVGAHTDKDGET